MAQAEAEAQAQAQAQSEGKIHENLEKDIKETLNASFKFNAQAPEFVPRSQTQMPISGYFYPCFQILGGAGSSDWFYVGDQDPTCLIPGTNLALPNCSKNIVTHDLQQKIVKQISYLDYDFPCYAIHEELNPRNDLVEYQFSDMSMLANESFLRQVNRDPEGFVPISLIASTKKVKALTGNIQLIAQAIRSSSKLVLSSDGKKVKRKLPFTEKDKEELQARTVVAENLPEDHSHQNLQKIFGVVGSAKTIRICHPVESNSSRPKGDLFISNKLHALVEYETTDIAEKAVDKLNDERNWRKGMRVRLLLRCSPKSVLKSRKSEFDGILDDDEILNFESAEDSSHTNNTDLNIETNVEENTPGSKKGWARGRGKGRGRVQSHGGRGLLAPPSQPSSIVLSEASANVKHSSISPRMPDGTRGFTMGRGKPVNSPASPISPQE